MLIEKAGAELLYLPPYSPDFNPIGRLVQDKQHLRASKARILDTLDLAITAAMAAITAQDSAVGFNTAVIGHGHHETALVAQH